MSSAFELGSAHGRWRRAVASLAVVLIAVGGLALTRTLSHPDSGGTARAAPPARFVGSQVCARCHPAEQAAWSSSHHRHAMEPAEPATALGDFSDARFRYFGRETRFWRRGAELL